jgi:phenylalanyl-tRNA synthetase beta chain
MVDGECVGVIGQIAPELMAARKILNAVFAAELFIGKLAAAVLPTARYEPLPRFPGVFRDLSFIVKNDVPYAAIESAIRAAAGPHLETVDCIDVFAGKGIAADSRSMAVSMAFRAPDRTLASEEVAAAVEQVIVHLAKNLGAELRG